MRPQVIYVTANICFDADDLVTAFATGGALR